MVKLDNEDRVNLEILKKPGISINEVGTKLGIDLPNMSRHVNSLRKQGLIKVKLVEDGRVVKTLYPSVRGPAGKLMKEVNPNYITIINRDYKNPDEFWDAFDSLVISNDPKEIDKVTSDFQKIPSKDKESLLVGFGASLIKMISNATERKLILSMTPEQKKAHIVFTEIFFGKKLANQIKHGRF